MIIYDRLWETMKIKGITQYDLIYHHGLSSSLINRLRNRQGVNTATLDRLCDILDCNVEDIIEHKKTEGQ